MHFFVFLIMAVGPWNIHMMTFYAKHSHIHPVWIVHGGNTFHWGVTSLWWYNMVLLQLNAAYWHIKRHRTRMPLLPVIACCMTVPSHNQNQCWLIIHEVDLLGILWKPSLVPVSKLRPRRSVISHIRYTQVPRKCPEPCRPLEWTTTDTSKSNVILCPKSNWTPAVNPQAHPAQWNLGGRRVTRFPFGPLNVFV